MTKAFLQSWAASEPTMPRKETVASWGWRKLESYLPLLRNRWRQHMLMTRIAHTRKTTNISSTPIWAAISDSKKTRPSALFQTISTSQMGPDKKISSMKLYFSRNIFNIFRSWTRISTTTWWPTLALRVQLTKVRQKEPRSRQSKPGRLLRKR